MRFWIWILLKNEEAVLLIMKKTLTTNIRKISHELDLLKNSMRILKENRLHILFYLILHILFYLKVPREHASRLTFCI